MKTNFFAIGALWLPSLVFTSKGMGQMPDSSMHPIDGAHYSIQIENDKVVALTVNGRKIPADSFVVYDPVIRKYMAEALEDRLRSDPDREQALRNKELAEKAMLGAERDKELAEKAMLGAEREKERMERDQLAAERTKEMAELMARQAQKEMQDAQQLAERVQKLAAEDLVARQKLVAEIVKDGLAKDEKSVVSITLNKDEFILNGKRQSDAIQKRYAAKYLLKSGHSISFHNEQ